MRLAVISALIDQIARFVTICNAVPGTANHVGQACVNHHRQLQEQTRLQHPQQIHRLCSPPACPRHCQHQSLQHKHPRGRLHRRLHRRLALLFQKMYASTAVRMHTVGGNQPLDVDDATSAQLKRFVVMQRAALGMEARVDRLYAHKHQLCRRHRRLHRQACSQPVASRHKKGRVTSESPTTFHQTQSLLASQVRELPVFLLPTDVVLLSKAQRASLLTY
mmetsp:Transcript_31515/g.94727  ORF Transcript_31515/g.94727 Transcript_31515/m.94727 type:complete len:220 (-) Transcript_31515:5572-6231(-)